MCYWFTFQCPPLEVNTVGTRAVPAASTINPTVYTDGRSYMDEFKASLGYETLYQRQNK